MRSRTKRKVTKGRISPHTKLSNDLQLTSRDGFSDAPLLQRSE